MQYLIDYTGTFGKRFEIDAPAGMSEGDMWQWLDNHDTEYERSLSDCELVSSESVVVAVRDGYTWGTDPALEREVSEYLSRYGWTLAA